MQPAHRKRGTACGEDNVVCEDTKWVNLNVNSRQREMARIFGGGAHRKTRCQISDKQGRKMLSTGCQSPTVAPCVSYPSRKKNTLVVKSYGATVHAAQQLGKAQTPVNFATEKCWHRRWVSSLPRDSLLLASQFHLICFAMANLTDEVMNVFSGA